MLSKVKGLLMTLLKVHYRLFGSIRFQEEVIGYGSGGTEKVIDSMRR